MFGGFAAVSLACASAAAFGQTGLPPAPATSDMEPQVATLILEARAGLEADPDEPEAWLAYGEVLHAHGLTLPAADAYREAIRLAPPGGLAGLGARYLLAHALRTRAPGEAVVALEGALAEHPGYVPARLLLGEIREELGDRAGAETAYRRALADEPDSPLGLLRAASIALEDGRAGEAIPLIERALAAQPEATAARSVLARALHAAGERERAREEARLAAADPARLPLIEDPIHFRMAERDISSPRLLSRAREALSAGRIAEAGSWYRDLAGIRPRDPDVLAEFGAVLEARGEFDEAAARHQDAVAVAPDHPGARAGLGRARMRAGDFSGAEYQFRLVVVVEPEDAGAHAALGEALLRQRRPAEALESLARASELEPKNAAPRLLAAAGLAELGRYVEAWEAVREAEALGAEASEAFLAALRERYPEPGA